MRRPPAVAILSGFLLFFLAGQAASAAAGAPAEAAGIGGGVVRLTIAGRKAIVPATIVDGATFVSLKGLAAAAGAKVAAGKTPGDLIVTSASVKLDFAAGRPGLVLATRPGTRMSSAVSLPSDARIVGNDLFIPLAGVDAILAALQGATGAGESAPPAGTVAVTLLGGEGYMRLVIQPAGAATWVLDRSDGQVSIRFSGKPGEAPWAARPIGSPILDRIRFESSPEAALVLRLDPGADFSGVSAVELREPQRIVVEMRGDTSHARTLRVADAGTAAPGVAAARRGLQTIVLDPGHGGEAKGAEGTGGQVEKEITLDVANRLAVLLRASGLRVILTRETDADLGLVDRTAAANREKADLFMSIHVNSSPRRDARGAETYFLAYQALDQDGRDLASAENEGAGFTNDDPASALDLVLWDLAQSEHLRESSQLAEIVQRELNAALDIRDRGVKQAPFRVLMGAGMPAVLVEVGFISNPAEESSLADGAYRDRIAGALGRAVLSFKQTFDRLRGVGAP